MIKTNGLFVSSHKPLKNMGREMKFRGMLILFVVILFSSILNAREDRVVSSNIVNSGDLNSSFTEKFNSSYLFDDLTTGSNAEADQQKRISGRIIDLKGAPLPGVTIMEKGTTNGALSDLNGDYSISISSGNSILQFTYVGFTAQDITVGSLTSINVTLIEATLQLDEVVVVGFGSQKKATVTGSVTSISTAKLIQTPETNITTQLVGKMSGVISTQASGAPGVDAASLKIRGMNTFAGNSDPLVMVDGIEAQNYNNIDPNEIESVSILKDASATAVYGVRGANGVLLITTKRGIIGKPKISYSSQVAVTRFEDMRQNMGSYEYATNYNEALKYDSFLTGTYTPKYSASDIEHYRLGDDPIFHPNSDWINMCFKEYATKSQHNLNISGGTEKIKYFVSIGYLNQGGQLNTKLLDVGFDPQLKYERYNFRSNFDFNITKRLTAKINLSSQIDENNGLGNVGNTLFSIFAINPTVSPGVVDGKIVNFMRSTYLIYNAPIIYVYNGAGDGTTTNMGINRTVTNFLNTSARFDYKLDFITEGLSAHATMAFQNVKAEYTRLVKTLVTYFAVDQGNGDIMYVPQQDESPWTGSDTGGGKSRKDDLEVGLDYLRTFGSHNISGLLLYNQSKLYNPNLSFAVPNGFQGLVGRVAYDYKRRYLAEFDFGYNGTENFAPGKRFGYFPAYSLGWVISEEPFFPKNNIVNFIKIRGSYGEVGNDKVGGSRFLYLPTAYTYSDSYYFGEIGTSRATYGQTAEGKLGNPNLTWERAKKSDVGIDLTLLKSKLKVTVDYFYEKRDNILSNLGTVPDLFGANLPAYNLGKMQNKGMDGEITFNNKIGEFNYFIKGVFTVTRNKILFKDEVKKLWSYQSQTGQSAGQNFAFVAEGIYNTWEDVNDAMRPVYNLNSNKMQPGDFRYKDVNGDGTINDFDKVPTGYSSFPERNFGLSFGGDFKGFDVSIMFTGGDHVTSIAGYMQRRGFEADYSTVDYLGKRNWTYERYAAGVKTDLPRVSAVGNLSSNYQDNTVWDENSAYVRLKNLELGYSFNANVLKRIGVSSTRLYFTATNLLTWDNLFPGEDPEIPTYTGQYQAYPLTQTFNIGINVNF